MLLFWLYFMINDKEIFHSQTNSPEDREISLSVSRLPYDSHRFPESVDVARFSGELVGHPRLSALTWLTRRDVSMFNG